MGRCCLLHPLRVGPPRRKGRATPADDRSSIPEDGENSVLPGPLRVMPLPLPLAADLPCARGERGDNLVYFPAPLNAIFLPQRGHTPKVQDRLDTLPQRTPRDTIGRDRRAAVADIVRSGPLGSAPVRMNGLACPAWTTLVDRLSSRDRRLVRNRG